MPVESFPLINDSWVHGKSVPRQADIAMEEPPSPKSLGDHLDKADPRIGPDRGNEPLAVAAATLFEESRNVLGPTPIEEIQMEVEETQFDENEIVAGEDAEATDVVKVPEACADVAHGIFQVTGSAPASNTGSHDETGGGAVQEEEEEVAIILGDVPSTSSSTGVDLANLV